MIPGIKSKSIDVVSEMKVFKDGIHKFEDELRDAGALLTVRHRFPDEQLLVDDIHTNLWIFGGNAGKVTIDTPVLVKSWLIWSTEVNIRHGIQTGSDSQRWSIQLETKGLVEGDEERMFFHERYRAFSFKYEDLCKIYRVFPGFVEQISGDLIKCYEKYNKDKHD